MKSLPHESAEQVVIYCRVSTDRQEEEGSSLDTQEQRCRSYCDERGWQVAKVYRETYSGGSLYDRRQLAALRQDVRAGLCTTVLSYAIDRLSRSQSHLAILMDELERYKVRLQFVSENFEDTVVGRFILSAKSFAAEVEREKVQERTTRGLRARAEQGKLMTGSRPPYGYTWAGERNSRLEIDHARAQIVQRIFETIAGGGSMRGTADSLNRDGIPSPTKCAAGWRASSIQSIVDNPTYIGKPVALRWERKVNSNGRSSTRKRSSGEIIHLPEGVAPPIVDEITFEAVSRRRQRNRAESRRRLTEEEAESYLLRGGFIVCGHCGATMMAQRAGQSHATSGPSYRCRRRATSAFAHCSGGSGVRIATRIIDDTVWKRVYALLTDPGVIAVELDKLDVTDPVAADIDATVRALAEIARKRSNLISTLALTDDNDTRIALTEALTTLSAQARQLEEARTDLESRRSVWSDARQRIGNLETWVRSVASKLNEATYTTKRDSLIALGVRVRVFKSGSPDRWLIDASIPLDGNSVYTTGRRSRSRTRRW